MSYIPRKSNPISRAIIKFQKINAQLEKENTRQMKEIKALLRIYLT